MSLEFNSAEAQRLYYLQALGIRSYYPAFVLPGAKASLPCELPEATPAQHDEASASASASSAAAERRPQPEVSAPAAPEAVAATAEQRQPVRPRIALEEPEAALSPARPQSDAAVPRQANPAEAQPADSDKAAAQDGAAVTQPPFSAVLVIAENSLALCIQIPALASAGLSAREQRLLQNLLHWLGCPQRSDVMLRSFNWPLPHVADQSRDLACRSLAGFLQQVRLDSGFNKLLVLGSGLHDVMPAAVEGGRGEWVQVHGHSLAEMLAVPELKRSLYHQLLPYKASFARSASRA